MSHVPYMPLFVRDYLAETADLTTLEQGALILLITHYWARGRALPADESRLANLTRLPLEEWQKISPAMVRYFEVTETEWRHLGLEKQLAEGLERTAQATLAGKKSAEARQKKAQFISAFDGNSTAKIDLAKQASNQCSTGAQRPLNLAQAPPEPQPDHSNSISNSNTNSGKKSHSTYPDDFEQFWKAWQPFEMGKGSRADAKTAYEKARKETDHDTIIRTSAEYCRGCAGIRSKTKHASSWLNSKGWADDRIGEVTAIGGMRPGFGSASRAPTALELALADRTRQGGSDERF